MNLGIALLLGLVAMMVVMSGLWLLQRVRGNASIVDVAWTFGVGLIGTFLAVVADGDPVRRVVIGVLVALWSLRLGSHLWKRIAATGIDGRYLDLQERWGENTQRNLFLFFQLQALWSVLFAAPMGFAASNATPFGTPWDFVGLAIFLVSITGETIADRQLSRFRSRSENAGKVCRDGLWSWSRHPNYFFEWLHWFAYVAFSMGSSWVWLACLGPLTMLWFLLRITGVPPTEARSLKTRGEAYRRYQATTNAFFPWPPKDSRP